MTQQDYVWYASYGSNLNKDRFLCYIKGGSPKGSDRVERGCWDQTLPLEDKAYTINRKLYFAKEAGGWQGGGVAFIGLEHDETYKTHSYMYLVTKEQFIDILCQENNMESLEFALDDVVTKGSEVFKEGAWYGNILYVGESDGYPIFTFTSPEDFDVEQARKPSAAYLSTITHGLKREVGLSDDQVFDYFSQIPGIKGFFTEGKLEKIIRN